MSTSRVEQPPDGETAWGNPSRRTFLKGAGLAGAAGVVMATGLNPFQATSSASAATTNGIILGCQWPSAWQGDGTTPWLDTVTALSASSRSAARGLRVYRNSEFDFDGKTPGCVGWWNSEALDSTTGDATGTPVFPGQEGSIPLASIRPHPALLNNSTDLDGKIKDMILDGASKAASGFFKGTPQLTVWHEAGHLYIDHTDLDPTDSTKSPTNPGGIPTNGTAAHTVRAMHTKMQNLVNDVNSAHPELPNVEYGSIVFGDIIKMANDSDLQGPTNWVPTNADGPLDWYGIDLYYEGDGAGTDCTHPDLATFDLVSSQLSTFAQMAQNRAGAGAPLQINICECNASAANDSNRPGYFQNLAKWLSGNSGFRMLTFFKDPAGPHSVPWSHVAPASKTVDALNSIQATYGR